MEFTELQKRKIIYIMCAVQETNELDECKRSSLAAGVCDSPVVHDAAIDDGLVKVVRIKQRLGSITPSHDLHVFDIITPTIAGGTKITAHPESQTRHSLVGRRLAGTDWTE